MADYATMLLHCNKFKLSIPFPKSLYKFTLYIVIRLVSKHFNNLK